MASPQFNLRLRDGLDEQVRELAARHSVEPRVIVEDALVGHFRLARRGPGVDPHQLAIPTETPLRVDDGAPAPETADQRGDEAGTPRRRRRKDPADKAGEAGTSGQAGRGVPAEARGGASGGDDPSGLSPTLHEPDGAALGGPPASSGRGCPECGGEVRPLAPDAGAPARLTCVECGYKPEESTE
jgi:hypothetical protein